MTLLESLNLPMGSPAPDFEGLTGIDGKKYSLESFNDSEILVICFICNHCPYVQAIWQRLVGLEGEFKSSGVGFVAINPNVGSDGYDEESIEKMGAYATEYGMEFPYLADPTQKVAQDYKAQCTPDIYVYNAERKLVYHGRVDDNWQEPEAVERRELAEALEVILKGGKVEEQKPAMGCSIKWK